MTLQQRILDRSVFDSGHWLWTRFVTPDGYGRYVVVDVPGEQLAHRVAYIAFRGPIPKGMTVDHLCRVRHCVNPDHLEVVDLRTNILRSDGLAARRARQTHCKYGHEFTPENTQPSSSGGRACRTCRREDGHRRYLARKAAA